MVDKPSSPAFTIGNSTISHKNNREFVPGPGAYDTINKYQPNKSGGAKLSEERFKQYGNQNPGPGTYNQANHVGNKQNALILSRPKQHLPALIPGPGAYNPNYNKLVKSMSGFKIGTSEKIADIVGYNRKLPGPGEYQTNISTVYKNNAPIMGNSQRTNMILNNYIPGPGQYQQSTNSQNIYKKQPQVIFGKSGRSFSTNDIVPGPGAYIIKDKLTQEMSKSRGYSIKARYQEVEKQKSPGPGAYNLQEIDKINHKILSFSIGKAAKLKMDNQKQVMILPGPQKYNANSSKYETKNTIIGKQKRSFYGDGQSIPGPGAYITKFHQKAPQYSIPKSILPNYKSVTPGPGTYDAKINGHSQYSKIQMNVDNRKPLYNEKQKKNIPGPGAYSYQLQKKTGFKIGNQKRQSKVSQGPGPGNYNIPSTIANVPKYQS